MNLKQAVHDFISALELTPSESDEASRQHVYLRDALAKRLRLDPDFNTFLTGSYARSTAIRPLKDIDVFCVMTPTATLDPLKHAPRAALDAVKAALEATYPAKTVKVQNRSVNIEFVGTGIGYDVVPAFADPDASREVFVIPDLKAARWIRSNPRVHKDRSVEANERAEGELKPLTKAVKHWNCRQPEGDRLRSFHIEVMAWEVITHKPESRVEGLATLFEGLSQRVLSRTPDPAGLGPDLDVDVETSARHVASKRFAEAAADVRRAIELARDGKTEAAHAVMFELFGAPYPERGRAETGSGGAGAGAAAAAVTLPGAPDGARSRFG